MHSLDEYVHYIKKKKNSSEFIVILCCFVLFVLDWRKDQATWPVIGRSAPESGAQTYTALTEPRGSGQSFIVHFVICLCKHVTALLHYHFVFYNGYILLFSLMMTCPFFYDVVWLGTPLSCRCLRHLSVSGDDGLTQTGGVRGVEGGV
jgi:hypothetical protein